MTFSDKYQVPNIQYNPCQNAKNEQEFPSSKGEPIWANEEDTKYFIGCAVILNDWPNCLHLSDKGMQWSYKYRNFIHYFVECDTMHAASGGVILWERKELD